MPVPIPPPKPEPLRTLSIISEETPAMPAVPTLPNGNSTGSDGSIKSNGHGSAKPTNGAPGDSPHPPGHSLAQSRTHESVMPQPATTNGSGPGPTVNGGFHRSSSSGSIDKQFARPRRAQTLGAVGGSESRWAEVPSSLTPRGPSRKQSQRRLIRPDGNVSALQLDLELEEEQFGVFAQKLINLLPKPRRTGAKGQFTFKDAITYFMRINRIRKAVGELLETSLCPTCTSLELKPEKFLVHDRDRSLKESRLGRSATNLKQPSGKFEVGSGSPSCRLGNLGSIWKKSVVCPLCRLIIHSLKEQENTEWISLEAIPGKETIAKRGEELQAVCFASWRIDGRELVEASQSRYESSRARTRRICLHWQPPIFRESFLVLVGTPTLPATFLGRRVESGRCNPKLMRDWINTCCKDHGSRCQTAGLHDPRFELMISQAFFGVIDVQDMRLVRLPSGERYVALSYTWGGDLPFRSLLSNVRKLQASRGIEKILGSLPRTLRDTIDLVRDLGERYLWVDSLCIVQDSDKSWELNASVMDLVYGNAFFTICAADGDKPSSGLHGMDPRQRHFSQHMEDYAPGMRLMVSFLAESYIQHSAWNTRGWTFQERLLSKRCLIFTDSRVFFQCRSTTMREDVAGEETTGWSIEHAHAPWQILDDLNTRAILLYMKSVERYTSRKLTRPENILSAFQGIANTIGRSLDPVQSRFLFGLPRSHFDWALLWEPRQAADERLIENKAYEGAAKNVAGEAVGSRKESGDSNASKKDSAEQAPAKKRLFPSWSWCGWQDSIMEYKTTSTLTGPTTHLHEWLMERTWITWYYRDGHGSLKLVWDRHKSAPGPTRPTDRWTGYNADPAAPDKQFDAYGRDLAHHWPKEKRDRFDKTLPEYPFGVLVSEERNEPDLQFPDQRFLQFWTWSAWLRLTEQPPACSPYGPCLAPKSANCCDREVRRYGIADYKGDWCGTMVLDPRRGRAFDGGAEQEFIAIAEAKEFAKDEYDSWMYYIPKEKEQSEWDLFYVLLIEVRDEIAYRVGLGKVFKEAFENSLRREKKWKEIILG